VTATLIISLVLQVACLVLLRYRLGRRWLRRPVPILVLGSAVSQGLAPALLTIPSLAVWDNFGLGVRQDAINTASLVMSLAMVTFTVSYLVTCGPAAIPAARPGDPRTAARALDWRVFGLLCIPLAVVTAAGHGYNDGTAAGQGTALSTDLVSTFFIAMVVLTSSGFLLRHGTRWFLPVFVAQSLLLGLAGERTPLVMDALALIIVLLRAGIRVPRRQLLAAAALTLVGSLAITGVRVQEGRSLFYTDSGLGARVSALMGGLRSASGNQPGQRGPNLIAQSAVRMNGTDFEGAIVQAEELGRPRLSAAYVPQSLLLAVPSFVWSSKLARGTALNPAQLEIDDFGLQQINFIPPFFGLYIGFLPVAWMAAFFAGLGLLFGWGERWLLRACTPVRLVLLAESVIAVLWYQAGLPTMVVEMRTAAALALSIKGLETLRQRRSRHGTPLLTVSAAAVPAPSHVSLHRAPAGPVPSGAPRP
jgi:hypothetical protein